jgi:hypothetical protein
MNKPSEVPSLDGLTFLGSGLNRPECVIGHQSGLLFASDWSGNGGVAVLFDNAVVGRVLARNPPRPMRPNGFAFEPGGSFLLADLGTDDGGIWRLYAGGEVEPVLTTFEGRSMPPTNFVHRDDENRLWITVSTSRKPRDHAYRKDVSDGFIIVLIAGRARLVAEGLGYTNECVVSPNGEHLYVNETFGRRTSRFRIRHDGSLGKKEFVSNYGVGTFPDGLAFDDDGGMWVTSIVSNRVIRVDAAGHQVVVLEDADVEHLNWVEDAFQKGNLGRTHLDRITSRVLRNISSLAFGGPKLRTAYLGCLLGDAIASFQSPFSGQAPSHWTANLGDLKRYLPLWHGAFPK